MNDETRKLLDLQWHPQGDTNPEYLEGTYFLVVETDGAFWTVNPARAIDPATGKGVRPEGIVFEDEKPLELARVIAEAGAKTVRVMRIERVEIVKGKTP